MEKLLNKDIVFVTKEKLQTYNKNKFVLALSGGIDSVCMFHILKFLNINFECVIIDHGLRSNSTKDAEFAKNLCQANNIYCDVFKWDGVVKNNTQNEARDARYGYIKNFAYSRDLENVILAHHIDDQAETFFINLFRGSGLRGLCSIKEISNRDNINYYRPWIDCVDKNMIINYADINKIKWVEDETNLKDDYVRNKIRNNFKNIHEWDFIKKKILHTINDLQGSFKVLEKHYSTLITDNAICKEDKVVFDRAFLKNLNFQELISILSEVIHSQGKTLKPTRRDTISKLAELIKSEAIYTRFSIGNSIVNIKKRIVEI